MDIPILLLLLAVLAVHFCRADQLPDNRRACDTKKIQILTKSTIRSDPIRFHIPSTEKGDDVRTVVDEECNKFNGARISRVPRGAVSKLRSFGEKIVRVPGLKKIGSRVMKPLKKAKKVSSLWKKLSGRKRPSIPKPSLGRKRSRVAAFFDLTGDVLGVVDTALQVAPEIIDVMKPESKEEEEEEEEVQQQQTEWDERLEEFREDVAGVLWNNTLEDNLLNHPLVRKEIGIAHKLLNTATASDVKCVRNFVKKHNLEFRVDIPVFATVEARQCGDIGQLADGVYEHYELPDSYIVERDGISYSLDGSLCIEMGDNTYACPESSLKEVNCSIERVETCKKTKYGINGEMTRVLPVGVVYYGPADILTLTDRSSSFKYSIKPYHLEYVRIPDRKELKIGEKIIN